MHGDDLAAFGAGLVDVDVDSRELCVVEVDARVGGGSLGPEEEEVEQDRGEGAGGDAGVEHGAEPVGELFEQGRVHDRKQAHRQGDRDDEDGVLVHLELGQGLDTGGRDHAEQCGGGPTQNRGRDGGDHRAELGQQAEHHQDGARAGDDVAGPHPAHGEQTDVLGEGGVREGVEHAAEHGGEAVGAEAVGDLAGSGLLPDDLAGGEEVAGGLDEGDQSDEDEGDHGGHREFGESEVERRGDADPALLTDTGEIDLAHECGDDGADGESDEDGGPGDGDGREALDDEDDEESEQSEADVGDAARVIAVSSGDVVRGDGDQGETDTGDDAAGDQWREHPEYPGEHRGHEEHEQAAGQDGSVDGGGAVIDSDDDHRGNGGEGAALDDGQACTEAQEADALEDRGDTGDEEVGGDQVGEVGRSHAAGLDHRAAQDEWNRDGPGVHRQNVLEGQWPQLCGRRDLVDGMDGVVGGVECCGLVLRGAQRGGPI